MPPRVPPRSLFRDSTKEIPDDIPLARRSARPALVSSRRWPFLLAAALGLATLTAVLALSFPQVLGQRSTDPMAGIEARPSPDGRLLGHYPYLEATPERLVSVAPGLRLHVDAAESLLAMKRDAAAAGVDLRLLSAFRDVELQKAIFFEVKSERNQSASERAKVSAPPGFSEHSTGFAVDLGDGSRPETNLKDVFDRTPAFLWLERNANRYHFKLSFPQGNDQGVSYEPWHWRFEGSAEALKLFETARQAAEIR